MSSVRYKMQRHSQEHTYIEDEKLLSLRIKTSGSCSKLARPGVQMIHIHSKRIMCEKF